MTNREYGMRCEDLAYLDVARDLLRRLYHSDNPAVSRDDLKKVRRTIARWIRRTKKEIVLLRSVGAADVPVSGEP